MANNETHYDKILGIKNGELVIVEYTFEDTENFKGATGFTMTPITKEQIEERRDFDNADKYMWKDAVQNDITELSFEEWWEDLVSECDDEYNLYPFDDNSFRSETIDMWNDLSDEDRGKLEEVFGVLGEDFASFEVSSCGRCIADKTDKDSDWEVILDENLLAKCKELEGVGSETAV